MYYDAKANTFPRKLRHIQTDAELRLWSKIRNNQLGCKFRRQHPIDKYIVDFICTDKNLIIELDGGKHNEDVDHERTTFLEAQGYIILRFWNTDVLKNTEAVIQLVINELNKSLTQPLPKGEELIL